MLVQEAVSCSKIFGMTMLEKHGTGELSRYFIIKNDIYFVVQILQKIRQDNGESEGDY